MDEESPRKSLVKGERFVRHDDTSELSQRCSSNTGLRWNIQRREGELHVDLFVGKKEEKKEREEKGGGRTLFFGNESGSREREPTAGEIVQLASPH